MTAQEGQSAWQSPWLWGVGGCCLGCVALPLLFVAIFGAGMFTFFSKSTGVIEPALELVRQHPAAVAALGEPIERGGLFDGRFDLSINNDGFELSVPVTGPLGGAQLEAEGEREGEGWRFDAATLELEDRRTLDLLGPWPE